MSRFQELCGGFFSTHSSSVFQKGLSCLFKCPTKTVLLDIFGQNGKAFPCFLDILKRIMKMEFLFGGGVVGLSTDTDQICW